MCTPSSMPPCFTHLQIQNRFTLGTHQCYTICTVLLWSYVALHLKVWTELCEKKLRMGMQHQYMYILDIGMGNRENSKLGIRLENGSCMNSTLSLGMVQSKYLTDKASSTSSQPFGSMLIIKWVCLRSLRLFSVTSTSSTSHGSVLEGVGSSIIGGNEPKRKWCWLMNIIIELLIK